MKPTLLYTHDSCLLHDTGPHHPERPQRVTAAVAGVRRWHPECETREAPMATVDDLALVHDPAYVDAIQEVCERGGGALDPDTSVVRESWEAALRSAGAGLAAAEAITRGEAEQAFLAVRPPGHHAHNARALGFCVFNNIAIVAERLVRDGARVAIVDWDVHHGDGTQDTFFQSNRVLYVSTHQFPFYPGTGWIDEVGRGEGVGYTVNVPLPEGARGDVINTAFRWVVEPVVSEFAPDWLLISAGYDAHRLDPLAGLDLEAEDYGWMAHRLGTFGLPTIVFFEGGYDLGAIEDSVAATMAGLSGIEFTGSTGSSSTGYAMVDLAASSAAAHWDTISRN